ncbi:craniofacial development protein 1-like [Littorina saxatilis]|uniref:Craniofacial development protein 1 n=1 Tax=Littorina saxatilis TaxID=31220 RepID=A0AAN9BYN1_9CAEN
MSDEEDYDSEEDVDYVPTDGDLGSEEENSGDEEDLSVLGDDAGTATGSKKTRGKKQSKGDVTPRKRKGGIKLEEDNNAEKETNGDAENTELAKKIQEEEAAKKAEKEKKKENDLWSRFLCDVKPAARPPPKASPASTATKQTTNSPASSAVSKNTTNTTSASSASQPASKKITITKVFDFAGEEIKVTKEVDADSKEAKEELKKEEERKEQEQASLSIPSPSSSTVPSATKLPATTSDAPGSSILGVKRPAPASGGLGNLLNKIGKKQKMGTLEKSKMDWDSFKKKEGIEEDLKIHNKGKDGYIERMAFLNRADVRQYEIERDLRLSKSGKR